MKNIWNFKKIEMNHRSVNNLEITLNEIQSHINLLAIKLQ